MLTAKRLRRFFQYDPKTGKMRRIVTKGSKAMAGTFAGTRRSDGYITIVIDWKRYLVHRLAYLYMTGRWPKADIDHVNGNPSDNRWTNLRRATRSENLQNRRRANKQSSTGYLGVSPTGNKFRARITHRGVEMQLGTFDTVVSAYAAYLKTKRQLHPYGSL